MEFERVALKRRMVRNFKSKPVKQEVIDKLLMLAQHAPSAGFTQGCAYVAVTRPDLKRSIGRIQGENDFYADRRKHKFVSEAPALIVVCVSEQLYHERYREADKAYASPRGNVQWPFPFWYFDIGCACMLIFLAAVNEGLTVAFTGIFRSDEMRELLGIPSHFKPVGVISIGYPASDIRSPSLKRGRRAFSEVVHYEKW